MVSGGGLAVLFLLLASTTAVPETDDVVNTHAPILRWETTIPKGTGEGLGQGGIGGGGGGVFVIRVNVTARPEVHPLWSTEIFQRQLGTWTGLAVYEGPVLQPGQAYTWTVEERWVAFPNGTRPVSPTWVRAGLGSFTASPDLPSAQEELRAVMTSPNMSTLWNGSWHSVTDRVAPSGFVPTSVSGGYGGRTVQFVRDACAQLLGLLSLGREHDSTVGLALRFMLGHLKARYEAGTFQAYAPHIMVANANLTDIVSTDPLDETDDTFYLIATWGRYVDLSGDVAMLRDFYALSANYSMHYLAPGARTLGVKDAHNVTHGGGVLYFNASLSLLLNPNLEHSRLISQWAAYDSLTNSFAVESLRVLGTAARRLAEAIPGLRDAYLADAAFWDQWRAVLLRGLHSSLSFSDPLLTEGEVVYAELRGHENAGFGGKEPKDEVGFSPLLWGLSYVNIVPIAMGLSGIDDAVGTGSKDVDEAMAKLGLNLTMLDSTWRAIRRLGSFQWINQDPALSAFVPVTHINASGWADPPPPAAAHEAPGAGTGEWCAYVGNCFEDSNACPAIGGKSCACPAFGVIGKTIGWELGYLALRRHFTRLIVLHRWLAAASHVELTDKFGESYAYACVKQGERDGFLPMNATNPAGSGCWGDPGNGVQIGWFLWGETLARTVAGLPRK